MIGISMHGVIEARERREKGKGQGRKKERKERRKATEERDGGCMTVRGRGSAIGRG